MTRNQKIAYILAHHDEQSQAEMARSLGVTRGSMCGLCKAAGITPSTKTERRIAAIREAGGTKTIREMARALGIHWSSVRRLCVKHDLPHKPDKCGGFREGHKKGRRRQPAIIPLFLDPKHRVPKSLLPDPEPKKIVRPKAQYDNSGYLDILNRYA